MCPFLSYVGRSPETVGGRGLCHGTGTTNRLDLSPGHAGKHFGPLHCSCMANQPIDAASERNSKQVFSPPRGSSCLDYTVSHYDTPVPNMLLRFVSLYLPLALI